MSGGHGARVDFWRPIIAAVAFAAADELRVALTAAPVPPADETEPQAGSSGDGGGRG